MNQLFVEEAAAWLAYNDADDTRTIRAVAEACNAGDDGWTFEVSLPDGRRRRSERVHLTPEELEAAITLAQTL